MPSALMSLFRDDSPLSIEMLFCGRDRNRDKNKMSALLASPSTGADVIFKRRFSPFFSSLFIELRGTILMSKSI